MFQEGRNNQLGQILLRDEDENKGKFTGFGNMRIGGDPQKSVLSRVLRKRTALECSDGCVSMLSQLHLQNFSSTHSSLASDYLTETALARTLTASLVSIPVESFCCCSYCF